MDVFLFINILSDLAISGIERRLNFTEKKILNTDLPKLEFINVISLVLNSTFFSFNITNFTSKIMGSPLLLLST